MASVRLSAVLYAAVLVQFISTLPQQGANAQYSAYSQYAKYPTLLRSTTIGAHNTANPNLKSDNAVLNPNLAVSLVDVEPEANLLLDESSIVSPTTNSNQNSLARGTSSQTQQQQHKQSKQHSSPHLNESDNDKLVDSRHFALVHPASSVLVRATYGPFSAQQTINPFSVTRNVSLSKDKNEESRKTHEIASGSKKSLNGNPSEQITAYLVTKEVRRSHPVLRVLFYASHIFEYRSHTPNFAGHEDDRTLCAAVIVQYHGERLFGTCSPSRNKQNACLAEVTIPALYWPPLDVSNGGIYAAKQQKSSTAKVYYTIAHIAPTQQCNDQNFLSLLASSTADGDGTVSDLSNAENSMNLLFLSDVSLVPFRGSYEEVTNDNVVTVLIPQEPVYPNSKVYIPVKYTYNPDYPVSAFSLRVQVKPGLKILGAQLSHPNKLWQLSVELGSKQTTATVTAFLRDYDQVSQQDSQSLPDELLENMSQEVYSWLIEVEENIDISEVNGRIVWQLLYNTDSSSIGRQFDVQRHQSLQQQEDEDFEKESSKLTSLIDIQKDVVQEILAITKSKELLNTAILNGRQVSRTMRIYQVSAAGSISDITFQCSCQSEDESILKVSPSCTSVYLDGSEVRGSQNATILIQYGSFTGQGNFVVWMPLIPLDVRVNDNKLSQIKGWRVPYRHKRAFSFGNYAENQVPSSNDNRFDFLDEEMLLDQSVRQNEKIWSAPSFVSASSSANNPFVNTCRLKFQQTRIEVYTRFLSTDHNSGREASLLNRRHSLRITHLVRNLIRISDPKVLKLHGNVVEGVGIGRADVEIISPLTGSVIGSKEIRVTMDRESITRMEVQLVSGISIDVEPFETNTHNIWTVRTNLHSKMTKQYQEAILDARLHFSDQSSVYLSDIPPSDYKLTVNTFKGIVDNITRDTGPYLGPNFSVGTLNHELPRIIALMPGQGELVHMSIDVVHACQRKKSQPLASLYVDIDVDFQLPDSSSALQNDAINSRRFSNVYNRRVANQTSKASEGFFNRMMNPGFSSKKRIAGGKDKYSVNEDNMVSFIPPRRSHTLFPSSDLNGDHITFQRHSTTSPSSESSLKFGIYSLMAVASVALIIVVILYSMFSFRFRHKNSYVTTTTSSIERGSRRAHNFAPFIGCVNSDANTSIYNDREWVWVSKNELENSAPNTRNEESDNLQHSLPLLPVKDFKAKQPIPNEHNMDCQFSDMTADQCHNQCSNGALHIISNPAERFSDEFMDEEEDFEDDQDSSTQQNIQRHSESKWSKPSTSSVDILIPPSHKPTRIVSTGALSLVSPDAPPPPIPFRTRHIPIPTKRGLLNTDSKTEDVSKSMALNRSVNNPSERINFVAPPVPVHQTNARIEKKRQAENNNSANNSIVESSHRISRNVFNPPPVPPHRNNSQLKPSTINPISSSPSSQPSSMQSSEHSRTPPTRPKNLCLKSKNSVKCPDSFEEKLESLDYQQMMKVFNRLKESEA